jgi:DMSO reductase anchor subunit/ferredoxin
MVTAACHHCLDPACLVGCPVDAYEKDEATGIVSHLDDQCIGCGYCMLTCPYEVPVFNAQRGIVRKCDMCQGRLAAAEAPACVQACPNGAIAITVVDRTATRLAATGRLVPGAPLSSLTVPATTYRTSRGSPPIVADLRERRVAPAHLPLAVMLVLTQLSVGTFGIDLVRRSYPTPVNREPHALGAAMALAVGLLALGASVLHLGRPRYCYRAVIGIGHSWLSREVVAFGLFTALAAPYAALRGLQAPGDGHGLTDILGVAVAASGLGGVGCSVMVYAATNRPRWRAVVIAPRFLASCAVSGLATVLCASLGSALLGRGESTASAPGAFGRLLPLALAVVMTVKLGGEAAIFRHLGGHPTDDRSRVASLLTGELRRTTVARFAAGLTGGVVLPIAMSMTARHLPSRVGVALACFALVGVVVGELAERRLFFTTASGPG